MNRLRELRAEKGDLVKQSRDILEKGQTEKRRLTDEESRKWDTLNEEIERVNGEIQRVERQVELDRELAATVSEQERAKVTDKVETPEAKRSKVYADAFRDYLRGGFGNISPEGMALLREERALQGTSGPQGQYLIPPMEWQNSLIKFVDDAVYIRQLATTYTLTSSDSLGTPSLDTDMADFTWTTELAIGSEDSSMAFGKREMTVHPLGGFVKVSNDLMMDSGQNPETIVRDRAGYKMGVSQEKAFLTGTGAKQPLGMFTASASGISTSADVSTGNTTTAVTADGLIEALYSLKTQYQNRATWLFHRDAVKQIRKLKTGDGQYLWAPGLSAGQPDQILNRPFIQSEFAPNTFTTGQYVGIVGDFSFYWIADKATTSIQRLVELYAASNQTGFLFRHRCDGMPVLEEAFARVKLA